MMNYNGTDWTMPYLYSSTDGNVVYAGSDGDVYKRQPQVMYAQSSTSVSPEEVNEMPVDSSSERISAVL